LDTFEGEWRTRVCKYYLQRRLIQIYLEPLSENRDCLDTCLDATVGLDNIYEMVQELLFSFYMDKMDAEYIHFWRSLRVGWGVYSTCIQ
jgi:hypothetical protein